MTQENEIKLNTPNENQSSTANKRTYQNIDSKYIDTDPISYITDLIIQVTKNATKGHGFSKRGVNALFLFLLTGGLLFKYTEFPQNLTGFFKIYAVPLVFLFYSIMDILRYIPFINNLYIIVFRQSDFICDTIINNSISLDELENYLASKSFTPQQFTDIIEHLIRENQFSPKCQVNLMNNYSLYEVESINYIKDLLLKFNFTSQAVCIFLCEMKTRLDYNYLDKLTEKYCDFPTVLFLAGALHKYKTNESKSLYKYGYEYEHNGGDLSISRGVLAAAFIVISLAAALIYNVYIFSSTSGPMTVNLSGNLSGSMSENLSANLSASPSILVVIVSLFVIIVISFLFNLFKDIQLEESVQKYLMDQNLDGEVVEHIVEDLNSIDYFERVNRPEE